MKRTAHLVNTSRGPIVVEAALIEALREGKIAGAAIDEGAWIPLRPDYCRPNVGGNAAHIGYVSRDLYQRFYTDTVENIRKWLDSEIASTSGDLG